MIRHLCVPGQQSDGQQLAGSWKCHYENTRADTGGHTRLTLCQVIDTSHKDID